MTPDTTIALRTTTGRVIAEGREGESLRDLVERLADEGVSLSGTDLRDADLRDARLRGADLRDADLSGARLRDADLRDADLSDADLSGTDLRDADLSGTDLRDADLSFAILRGALLSGADLRGAILRGAILSGADLHGARLTGARIGWFSRDLVAELLRRAAGDSLGLQMIAELPLLHRDLCWSQFATLQIPGQPDAFSWACAALRPYVTEDDGAPACLREVQP